jgi:hypothetical protein
MSYTLSVSPSRDQRYRSVAEPTSLQHSYIEARKPQRILISSQLFFSSPVLFLSSFRD